MSRLKQCFHNSIYAASDHTVQLTSSKNFSFKSVFTYLLTYFKSVSAILHTKKVPAKNQMGNCSFLLKT